MQKKLKKIGLAEINEFFSKNSLYFLLTTIKPWTITDKSLHFEQTISSFLDNKFVGSLLIMYLYTFM